MSTECFRNISTKLPSITTQIGQISTTKNMTIMTIGMINTPESFSAKDPEFLI